MGLFDKLFKKKEKKQEYSISHYIDGRYPSYSQFGNNIYASDVVQQAIYSIVTELKKLDPTHIKYINNEYIPVNNHNIQRVLDNPNPLMTTSDFIEKIVWNLMLNYNSFIYPIWNGNNLEALYPLQPKYVDFIQNNFGELFVKMRFGNGYESTLPYKDIIHIRHKYSVSEFMGGDESGQPDNKPLLETLKINDTLIKGLAKSLNLQTSVNGIIKYKNMHNTTEQLERIEDFETKLKSNSSGLVSLDMLEEYIPINKQIQLLDATTLEFIDRKILRTFGTSIAIINGDYTKAQYEAFYQKTLEPIIKSLNQAFTKGLFSQRELGFNNKIVFYAKELIFMTNSEKLTLANLLVDSGSCYKNELRTMFGLTPLAELNGQLAESSNKTNAENNKTDDKQDGKVEEEPSNTDDEGAEENE